jgi:hypothetical protein
MTHKEKAEELVGKFQEHAQYWDCYNDEPLEENHSKQCALLDNQSTHIAIQKFLNSIARHLPGEHANQLSKEQLEKYKSIEEEIKKL